MAAAINVDYINPFLGATVKVIKDACQMDVTLGKPSLKEAVFTEDELLILMGITGEMKGQAILDFNIPGALEIATKMCMMPMTELNELSESAICELCNMILGNTATLFSVKGIGIDITPPTICTGNVSFNSAFAANICLPVIYEGHEIFQINIAIKGDD